MIIFLSVEYCVIFCRKYYQKIEIMCCQNFQSPSSQCIDADEAHIVTKTYEIYICYVSKITTQQLKLNCQTFPYYFLYCPLFSQNTIFIQSDMFVLEEIFKITCLMALCPRYTYRAPKQSFFRVSSSL